MARARTPSPALVSQKEIARLIKRSTQQVVNQVSTAGNDDGHSVKACPAASLLTGGGFAGNQNLFVFTEAATGSSWVSSVR